MNECTKNYYRYLFKSKKILNLIMKEKSKNCNKQRGRLIEEIPYYTL